MSTEVQHDRETKTFTVDIDGYHCLLEYTLSGSIMTIVHTGVPQAVAGRGIAARLMHAALETARTTGWKVVPACTYAAAYVQRNTEYADIVIANIKN